MNRVGLGACALIVLVSVGAVIWKSSSAGSDPPDVIAAYANNPRSLIEASIAEFEHASSYRVDLRSHSKLGQGDSGPTGDRETLEVELPDKLHLSGVGATMEAVVSGDHSYFRNCPDACHEWLKFPVGQFYAYHPTGGYEDTLAIIALDMSRGTSWVGVEADGRNQLAHIRGRVNPERVEFENYVRRRAADAGLIKLGDHCGQPIPEGPTPRPGTCPDLKVDEAIKVGRSEESVRFYDENMASLDAWIDLATLRVVEVSMSAGFAPPEGGLLFYDAQYSRFDRVQIVVPPSAREGN